MKANEVAINSFLSQTKRQFIIPVYHRNYDQTEDQCGQMFFDILEVGRNKDGCILKPAPVYYVQIKDSFYYFINVNLKLKFIYDSYKRNI